MDEATQAVADELDLCHEKAMDAFRRKDLRAYMALFTPDLSYRQSSGRVIGRDQLANNVAAQFSMLHSAESSFLREELVVSGQEATEQLKQIATLTTKHLRIFYRTWMMERQGRYVWIRTDQGWCIRQVDVLHESAKPGSVSLSPPPI
jgi:ketosteroid isomerase-like protein